MPTAAYCWTVSWEQSARRPDRPRLTDSITSGAARTRSAGVRPPKPRRLLLRRRRKIRSSIRPSPIRMRGSRRARPFRHWNTPRRIRFRSFRTRVRPEFTTGWPSPAPICGIPRKPATIRAPWGIRCRTAIRGTILRTIRTAMWTEPRNGMGRKVRHDLHFRRSEGLVPDIGLP